MRQTFVLMMLLLACGCAFERHFSIKPGVNQVIEVESGDRWFFELDENATTGYQWDYSCSDDDVEVAVNHVAADAGDGSCGVPGKAKVMIRIHRGYDGPSVITFKYRRSWENSAPLKKFSISLFKRTGDTAFWK